MLRAVFQHGCIEKRDAAIESPCRRPVSSDMRDAADIAFREKIRAVCLFEGFHRHAVCRFSAKPFI